MSKVNDGYVELDLDSLEAGNINNIDLRKGVENSIKEPQVEDEDGIEVGMQEEENEVLEDNEPDIEVEEEVEEAPEEAIEDTEKEEDEPQPKKERKFKPDEDKRKSRAKKRIEQLLEERKEHQKRIEELQAEVSNLRKTNVNSNKTTREELVKQLESKMKNLEEQHIAALENADYAKATSLQSEIFGTKVQIEKVGMEIAHFERQGQQSTQAKETQSQQEVSQVPEKALEWIDEYPQFKTDELFHVAAITVNNKLLQEGFDPNTDEFYEELTDRLSGRFPEIFAIEGGNSVQYTKDSSSKSAQKDVKKKADEPIKTQTVSGASRSPSSGFTSKSRPHSSKNSVKFSPEEILMAERLGLDLKTVAKSKKAILESGDANGYVQIL